MPVRFNWAF